MAETVESISQRGILSPLIARPRPDGDGYEIISGHRRQYAAKKAGLDTVPVIVRNMTDDDAIILLVDSNIQRENILPSERAFAFKMKMDAIKRQGARSDLTSAQVAPKLSSEKIGEDAPTLIVATVTSRTEKKKYQPTHVLIAHNTAFEKPSVVQLEQIFTIDKSRIQRFLGQTTRNEMRRIEEALMNSLEINEWDRRNADE